MKFSIRDLMWFILVIGIGLAWWIDRSRLELAKRIYQSDAHYLSGLFGVESGVWSDERLNELQRKYHPEMTAKPAPLSNSQAPTSNQPKK